MLRNVEITYGTIPGQACKLCGNLATRVGTLVDPNGHRWLICSECIDNLWAGNQAMITEERVQEAARKLIEERLLGGGGV